jgi:signal transduction histidine kinase
MNTHSSFNKIDGTIEIGKNSLLGKNLHGNADFPGDLKEERQIWSTLLHDIRKPLATSKGFLSRLLLHKAGTLTPKQKEYLEIIHWNNKDIESLLDQFSHILKMRLKHPAPDFGAFDISAHVSNIVDAVSVEAEQKGITISLENSVHEHVVHADRTMVSRIFRNLIDNSLKHTENGGTITILVTERDHDILIQIKDTGEGIPADKLQKIFSPFYQVHSSALGSGLGLYIVKKLVEMQGGDIWLESVQGKGTTISFTLMKNESAKTEYFEPVKDVVRKTSKNDFIPF